MSQGNASPRKREAAEGLFVACGVWLIGLGCYFILIRPALSPEDARYIGSDVADLNAAAPHIADWLSLVFKVMGGFMAGVGVLLVYVAMNLLPRRLPGVAGVLLLAGLLSVGVISATNFALSSDFIWLLLVPVLVWLAGLVLHVASRRRHHE